MIQLHDKTTLDSTQCVYNWFEIDVLPFHSLTIRKVRRSFTFIFLPLQYRDNIENLHVVRLREITVRHR